ncbi:hypothetical protein TIFTF001_021490 [Ficus carica]|uniref:Uncharacterized protein n=1 Tax=Ficus carica TaxID=3494 RepID=A0AA88DEM4_FICCA|nr:hypothetical protein TIFTF001_021490 [Ficus carica]
MGSIKMAKRNSDVGRRALNILRIALLWARKGGVLRRRLMTELRLLPKFMRGLGHVDTTSAQRNRIIRYGERQLSFDKTPIFPRITVKVNGSSSMRFLHNHIRCLNPPVEDFDDYEFGGEEYDVVYDTARKSFLTNGEDQEYYDEEGGEEEEEKCVSFEENDNEENNIDTRAEEEIENRVPVGSKLLVKKIRLRLITMHILYLLLNVLVGLGGGMFSG